MGSNYKDELLKVIDESNLPKYMGGKCTVHSGDCILNGGKFPDLVEKTESSKEDEYVVLFFIFYFLFFIFYFKFII